MSAPPDVCTLPHGDAELRPRDCLASAKALIGAVAGRFLFRYGAVTRVTPLGQRFRRIDVTANFVPFASSNSSCAVRDGKDARFIAE